MRSSATNWSEQEDGFTQAVYEQQQAQFWLSEEIPIASDALDWRSLSENERWVYTHVSAGLNAMDTLQGEVGMPTLHRLVAGHQRKATLALMGMFENIHARSYSMANKTFLTTREESDIFRWIESQEQLQRKINLLRNIYEEETSLWKKMATSCLLETALFYSGFFYPLYLAGQGRMVHMGEVFSLIIKDEALHGTYVGLLAQEQYRQMTQCERDEAFDWFCSFAQTLYHNECEYTAEIYNRLGLVSEVEAFVRYNFGICCDNLGLPRIFSDEEVNPVVLHGITARNTTHDFFSSKGNSYQKLRAEPLTDELIEAVWNV